MFQESCHKNVIILTDSKVAFAQIQKNEDFVGEIFKEVLYL